VSYELVINSSSDEVVTALLYENKLVEIHKEGLDDRFNVGDVYLGKVKKIVPSLNAAFVDVGYEKDAFLHYLDLGPQYRSMSKFVKDSISGKQSTHKAWL
jgi:ribonuclease G